MIHRRMTGKPHRTGPKRHQPALNWHQTPIQMPKSHHQYKITKWQFWRRIMILTVKIKTTEYKNDNGKEKTNRKHKADA